MKRRFAFVALVTFALASTAIACQIIAGIERVSPDDRPPDAYMFVPDVFEAAVIPDPCAHAVPPPPPTVDDAPGTDQQLPSFVVAMRELHLTPKDDAGAPLGYDLDGVCTCDARPGAAHDGGSSCNGPKQCDADGGIDNGMLALVEQFGSFVPDIDKSAHINDEIGYGNINALVEITDYNGRANDKDVSVGIITSYGLRDPSGCNTADGGAFPPYPPGWCGNDIWSVDPLAVIGAATPYAPALVSAAYVSNFTLVIQDLSGYFEIPFGDVRLRLYSPIVTAKIVPLDSSLNPRDPSAPPGPNDRYFALEDGLLAGRLTSNTLLAAIGSLRAPGSSDSGSNQKYVCELSVFPVAIQRFCASRDIAQNHQVDFDPNAPCDSISETIAFRAAPAVAGAKFPGDPTSNPCAQADGGMLDSYQCPP